MRINAKKLAGVRASMMPQPNAGQQQALTMAERLDQQERWLVARLEGTRALKSAVTTLYGTLSEDQKKTANELLAPQMGMGMMPMMPGQMQPSQMQPGQMQPGRMQPGQMMCGQMMPGQMQPGQMMCGQMMPSQMQPGQMQPNPPLQHPGSGMYTPIPPPQRQAFAVGDPVRGEKAYATACARCHPSIARITRRIEGRTPEQKQVWLDGFLSNHNAPEDTTRADLIAFILTK